MPRANHYNRTPREKLVEARSVGWIVEEDKECIVLVPHIVDDDNGDGEVRIPRDWCQKITDLVEKPRRKR